MCSVYSVRAVWCWAEVAAGRPFPGFFSFPLEANSRRVVSHEVVLGGKLAAKTSFSLSRPSSPRVEELKGELATADPSSHCVLVCLSVQ